jgi:hypothetical protein
MDVYNDKPAAVSAPAVYFRTACWKGCGDIQTYSRSQGLNSQL